MQLPDILLGLNAAHVRYVVVGGVAANAHGSPRITMDVDICYDPAPDNREQLAARLDSSRAYMRGDEREPPLRSDA